MKRRNLTDQLLTALRDTSVVYLQGPRQAGKSTLAHALQQEVDFVLEDARGRLVGIEVKKTASPTSGDFKGLRHLSEQTGKKFLRGILLYTGSTSVAFEPNLHAVPVSALWQLEAKLTEPWKHLLIASLNLGIVQRRAIFGTPDLVVELIAPSSVRRDRYDKRELYARFGVKEYWIGDPANKSLEILTLKEGRFDLQCAAEIQGKLTSLLLQGLEFDLKEIQ